MSIFEALGLTLTKGFSPRPFTQGCLMRGGASIWHDMGTWILPHSQHWSHSSPLPNATQDGAFFFHIWNTFEAYHGSSSPKWPFGNDSLLLRHENRSQLRLITSSFSTRILISGLVSARYEISIQFLIRMHDPLVDGRHWPKSSPRAKRAWSFSFEQAGWMCMCRAQISSSDFETLLC